MILMQTLDLLIGTLGVLAAIAATGLWLCGGRGNVQFSD